MKTKCFLFVLLTIACFSSLQAQWSGINDLIFSNPNLGAQIGIGTNTPVSALDIFQGRLNIMPDTADHIGITLTTETGASVNFRPYTNSSSNLLFDVDLHSVTDSSGAILRFFRQTNTVGPKRVDFMRGNGAAQADTRIGIDGHDSFFNRFGGNVAIGKQNPTATLDVDGDLKVRGANHRSYRFWVDEDDDLNILGGENISQKNILLRGGQVGIGMTNPSARLHVNGALKLRSDNNHNYTLRVDNNGDFNFVGDSSHVAMKIADGNGNVRIMKGSLGIGTRPDHKLHVKGVFKIENEENGNSFRLRTNEDGHLLFKRDGGNTAMMIQDHNGAVGIGSNITSIPSSYRLAVDGRVICEALRVEMSGAWPDYVFADDYQLMPIQDLEKHIKEKKHLPGIPSAKDMQTKGGQDVGEIQRQMLEKIEELTLYLIELEKKNQVLYDRLKALENK